jgi:hypothetical protein
VRVGVSFDYGFEMEIIVLVFIFGYGLFEILDGEFVVIGGDREWR